MDAALALLEGYYDDYGEKHELVGGKVCAMAQPTTNHLLISGNIYRAFANHLAGKACKPFPDGAFLSLAPGERYIPDGMVVCDRDKIRPDGVHGAPDLAVEILSPSTALNDRLVKRRAYEAAGVREYWIVDPLRLIVEVYRLEGGRYAAPAIYALRSPATPQEIRPSVGGGFSVGLEAIFADLIADRKEP